MAKSSAHHKIRAALRANPDGLFVSQIIELTGIIPSTLYPALRKMPDTYRDRYDVDPSSGFTLAIWIAVVPPPDCPKPKTSRPR